MFFDRGLKNWMSVFSTSGRAFAKIFFPNKVRVGDLIRQSLDCEIRLTSFFFSSVRNIWDVVATSNCACFATCAWVNLVVG